ncbi:epoxide hydrolase family protein [uncultured Enterovirga sp.]|uniref:epoxide hydrolase family protein n=1 Tax=uncultured Enterovirga sp. TaxID=2026352 RepID=UPI0035CA0923
MGHQDSANPTRRAILRSTLAAAALGPILPRWAAAAGKPVSEYRVAWNAEALGRLREQIQAFRFPRSIQGSGWRYGVDPDYLRALVAYWGNGFDMEGAAGVLNRFPQYTTRVDDLDIHFIRVVGEGGPGKARRPLLLTHGWPGSTFEFWDTIAPLAFPSASGAAGEVAFDLIIPSLPGCGPSGKPGRPIGARTTARLWDKLMRENLGYSTIMRRGGDWGAGVTGWLAIDRPDAVKAIHLNLMIVAPEILPRTEAERAFLRDAEVHERRWGAYYHLQATEPQSLAYAMIDDPVAQAAWLIQRFYHWSDRRTRAFDQIFSMDRLLTNVMIYVMNDAFQTSTWFYTGSQEERVKHMPDGIRVEVPTGFASYPGDGRSPAPPRSIVEQGHNLRHWAEMPSGGHFAAMEVPDLYVRNLRDWAGSLDL